MNRFDLVVLSLVTQGVEILVVLLAAAWLLALPGLVMILPLWAFSPLVPAEIVIVSGVALNFAGFAYFSTHLRGLGPKLFIGVFGHLVNLGQRPN